VEGIASVTVNEYRGGQLAADALYRHGHRKVGTLWRFRARHRQDPRICGFFDRAAELGLEIPEGANIRLFATPATESINNQNVYLFEREATRGIKTLLGRETEVSALYISSDFLAFPIVQYLDRQGIRLGEDLSVISFDDFESLGEQPWDTPRLTSINIPRAEIGRIGAELLVDALKLGPAPNLCLEPTLTVRSSLGFRR